MPSNKVKKVGGPIAHKDIALWLTLRGNRLFVSLPTRGTHGHKIEVDITPVWNFLKEALDNPTHSSPKITTKKKLT